MEIPSDPNNKTLLVARFDPRLEKYFLWQALFVLVLFIVTIPLAPLWFIFGRSIHKRQYEALECELTENTLNFRQGFLFKVQKNVPLDKITDLALNEGPILRYLGLCSLVVETAGGGGAAGATGNMSLFGVVDPIEFRNAVLKQRDLVSLSLRPVRAQVAEGGESQIEVLAGIRDGLQRIETLLEKRS